MFTFDDGHYRDPWYLEGNGIFVKFSVSPLRECLRWVTTAVI